MARCNGRDCYFDYHISVISWSSAVYFSILVLPKSAISRDLGIILHSMCLPHDDQTFMEEQSLTIIQGNVRGSVSSVMVPKTTGMHMGVDRRS